MKRLKDISTIATVMLASVMAASCADDHSPDMQPCQLAVSAGMELSVSGEAETRSTLAQDETFDDSQSIAVYAVATGTGSTSTAKPKSVTASSSATATGLFWPEGKNIDVFGWYPVNGSGGVTTATALNGTATFTIQPDQSSVANYRKSDLMFAKLTDQSHTVGETSKTLALKFSHLLSRIQVKLTAGAGMTAADLSGATITIGTSGAYITGSVPISSIYGGTVGTASGSLNALLTLCTSYDSSNNNNAFAIIPPQNLNGKRLTVKLSSGAEMYVTLPSLNMTGGNAYTYTATIAAAAVTVTATISDWGTKTGTITTGGDQNL